jgi:putative hydrolase of the HAD superfamily
VVAAVIFDLDGVLRRFDAVAQARAERLVGLPEGTISRVAFSTEHVDAAVRGHISDEQWQAAVVASLSELVPERAAREAVRSWFNTGSVDVEVLTLIQTVRRRCPVLLLTNGTSRLERDLEIMGLASEFDEIISSHRTGFTKPDPRSYASADEAVCRLLGGHVAAGSVLFVDDTPAHVQGARAHGWRTLHFTDASALAGGLTSLGLL